MAQNFDEDDEKPLDPAVERVRRRVVRFIGINLAILFAALMAVAIAIVYRMGSDGEAAAPETGSTDIAEAGTIDLPAGARIVSQSLSGNRLSLAIELSGGERAFLIYDLSSGAVVSRVSVETR